MADSDEPRPTWLELTAHFALLGGLIAAGVGLLLGSLPFLAGAFLLAIAPAQMALWECRRNCENSQPCDVEPQEAGKCQQAPVVELEDGRRFQELVEGKGKSIGRAVS